MPLPALWELSCYHFSGQSALYLFGEIGTLDISDIDFLIVAEDDQWRLARNTASAIIDSSGLLHYLFVHEPFIICRSLVPTFLCYIPWKIVSSFRILGSIRQSDDQDQPEYDARLFRHAIWNSVMRVGATSLDNTEIGLRRSLIL